MVSTKNQDTGIQLVNKLTSNTTERNQLWKDTPETRMSKNNNKLRINENFISSGQLTAVESVIKILNLVEMSESM